MENEKAYDEVKIQEVGYSLTLTMPKRCSNFLELKKGDTICVDAESGKYGKYLSIWKKEEKE